MPPLRIISKSTEGFLFKLFGGPIDWKACKQKTVTTSTTKAELLALSHTAKDYLWWKRLFADIGLDLEDENDVVTISKQSPFSNEKIPYSKHS